MLTTDKTHVYIDLQESLIRSKLINFLENQGVKEIEGKPLEECYTFQLDKMAKYWKLNELRFSVEAV